MKTDISDLATSLATIAVATGAFCTISVSIDGRPGTGDEDEEKADEPAADAPRPEAASAAQAKHPEGPLFDLAAIAAGKFTDLVYSIASVATEQQQEAEIARATAAAVSNGAVKGFDPHVSTRGFRRGDRVVDISGDYATVVGTPNGHTEVLFDGMRQFNVMIGVSQDLLTKVPDQKTMETPVDSYGWKFQLGSQVVLETSREAYACRKQQEEIDEKRKNANLRVDELGSIGVYHGPIEEGFVIGRAEHTNGLKTYEVRYRSGCGAQVEVWLDEDAICQPWAEPVAEKTDGE